MYIGGIDIGTTGCKIVIYNEEGTYINKFYREYDVMRKGGLHEVSLENIWKSVIEILKCASEYSPIGAIGVTSFGETFAMLDENDNIIAPSMLYTDPRGSDEYKYLNEKLGEDKISVTVGCKPHSMYSLPKMMWIKNNMPEEFAKAKMVLLVEDFIVYKLSGKRQIDYSLAARTMALDLRNKCWYKDLFDVAGIDTALMSELVESGTPAGTIKADVAELAGISKDTVIVSGCQDQIASAIGAGAFNKETAVDGIGTVECVTLIMDEPPKEPEFYSGGYAVVPHIDGKYACYALSYAGGATLKWFRDTFASYENKIAETAGKNIYAVLDNEMPTEPTGLLVLPHFAGAATPYMDSAAKASIVGLTFESTKLDIYRALMEGTSYEIAVNMEILDKFGIKPDKLVATGGGAASDFWLQIKSDILRVPITALSVSEVGGAGTVALTGCAAGIFNSLEEAVSLLVAKRHTFTPNTEMGKKYAEHYKKYRKLYKAIKSTED